MGFLLGFVVCFFFFAFNLKDILGCNNAFFVFSSFTVLKLHNKYSDLKIFRLS